MFVQLLLVCVWAGEVCVGVWFECAYMCAGALAHTGMCSGLRLIDIRLPFLVATLVFEIGFPELGAGPCH